MIRNNNFISKIETDDYGIYITAIINDEDFGDIMRCEYDKEKSEIFISDFIIDKPSPFLPLGMKDYSYLKYIGKGYYTQAMNMLLNHAKENGFHKITGKLADVDKGDWRDKDHRKRQIKFYKKFGFKILPSEECPNEIELILE